MPPLQPSPNLQACFTIPLISNSEICGYQLLTTCVEYTNLQITLMVLGGIFLLWSHIVWLLVRWADVY